MPLADEILSNHFDEVYGKIESLGQEISSGVKTQPVAIEELKHFLNENSYTLKPVKHSSRLPNCYPMSLGFHLALAGNVAATELLIILGEDFYEVAAAAALNDDFNYVVDLVNRGAELISVIYTLALAEKQDLIDKLIAKYLTTKNLKNELLLNVAEALCSAGKFDKARLLVDFSGSGALTPNVGKIYAAVANKNLDKINYIYRTTPPENRLHILCIVAAVAGAAANIESEESYINSLIALLDEGKDVSAFKMQYCIALILNGYVEKFYQLLTAGVGNSDEYISSANVIIKCLLEYGYLSFANYLLEDLVNKNALTNEVINKLINYIFELELDLECYRDILKYLTSLPMINIEKLFISVNWNKFNPKFIPLLEPTTLKGFKIINILLDDIAANIDDKKISDLCKAMEQVKIPCMELCISTKAEQIGSPPALHRLANLKGKTDELIIEFRSNGYEFRFSVHDNMATFAPSEYGSIKRHINHSLFSLLGAFEVDAIDFSQVTSIDMDDLKKKISGTHITQIEGVDDDELSRILGKNFDNVQINHEKTIGGSAGTKAEPRNTSQLRPRF